MRGRTPTRAERLHMDLVRGLGCIACRQQTGQRTPRERTAIHHCDGKTKEGCHYKTLPLCFDHHQGGASEGQFVSRHPWKARFETEYGTEKELLEQTRLELEYPF